MTEYDYSPEAYDRYLATQNRIANWVDKTEQHRAEFQSANTGHPPDLTRSGPGPASHSRAKAPSPHSGQSQRVIYPPPPESVSSSSSSSDSYHHVPLPAQMHRPGPGMVLPQIPQQQRLSSPTPMMMQPVFVPSPHRPSHHHRHRSRDHRRSRSHHSPVYYTVASPPMAPGVQYTAYPGSNPVYPMMPQYQMPVMSNSSQRPPRSAPASVTAFSAPLAQPTCYFQPQPSSAFLPQNSQPSSPQPAWSPYGVPPPPYPMTSTLTGAPSQYPGVPTYQSFAVQQPQSSYVIPVPHQRVFDLRA